MGLKVKCPKDSGQGPKSIGNSSEVLLHIGSVQLCKTLHRALPSLNTEAWPPYAAIKTEMSTLSSKLTSHCAVQNPCRYPRVFEGHIQKAARGATEGPKKWPQVLGNMAKLCIVQGFRYDPNVTRSTILQALSKKSS